MKPQAGTHALSLPITGKHLHGNAPFSYPNGTIDLVDLTYAIKQETKSHCDTKSAPPPPLATACEKQQKYYFPCEHKFKSFAGDVTIESPDKAFHVACLSLLDMTCMGPDLNIGPDKCGSFSFNGAKLDKYFQIPLWNGYTINISKMAHTF